LEPGDDALVAIRRNSLSALFAAMVTSPNDKNNTPAVKAKPRSEANRVLVTGGAGFVGSHLCDFLVNRGDHVSAVVDAP
jgi:NADPH:quinone reductase-like Zn-dependent oxidoreductase